MAATRYEKREAAVSLPTARLPGTNLADLAVKLLGDSMPWAFGEIIRQIDSVQPLLASWERKSHPAQVRLAAYLDMLVRALGPFQESPRPLALGMDIDVGDASRLLRHYDLENYLTPVATRLGHHQFVLASARKQVGNGSRIWIAHAERAEIDADGDTETRCRFACRMGGSVQTKSWKQRLRRELSAQVLLALPHGPVAIDVAWRCSRRRNWVPLWKPTIDSMGPVLGESDPRNPFNPDNDRIIHLSLQVNRDDSLRHDIDVAMCWRNAKQ